MSCSPQEMSARLRKMAEASKQEDGRQRTDNTLQASKAQHSRTSQLLPVRLPPFKLEVMCEEAAEQCITATRLQPQCTGVACLPLQTAGTMIPGSIVNFPTTSVCLTNAAQHCMLLPKKLVCVFVPAAISCTLRAPAPSAQPQQLSASEASRPPSDGRPADASAVARAGAWLPTKHWKPTAEKGM